MKVDVSIIDRCFTHSSRYEAIHHCLLLCNDDAWFRYIDIAIREYDLVDTDIAPILFLGNRALEFKDSDIVHFRLIPMAPNRLNDLIMNILRYHVEGCDSSIYRGRACDGYMALMGAGVLGIWGGLDAFASKGQCAYVDDDGVLMFAKRNGDYALVWRAFYESDRGGIRIPVNVFINQF